MGSELGLKGKTSVRELCIQVSLILGHIYHQYEFKVIFQVTYLPLPSDAHGGVTRFKKKKNLKYQNLMSGHCRVYTPLNITYI